ncbi:hypothetical protein NPIL_358351 [Nephila pilipes]|uniref:Uncharacterized protein n=1 Tax=Nephila pilipes TaxID=299642 RepID=A0A8X6NTL7_NEPPI|nr:hypothetical protein NPIL_358351 [Nephila pilipes]
MHELNSLKNCCRDLSNHEIRWHFKDPASDKENICFACTIMNLENDELLVAQKGAALSLLRDVLRSNPQVIVNLLQDDDQIAIHTAIILLSK